MPEGLTDMEQAFDLNTGEVLEHWQVAFASVSASRTPWQSSTATRSP